MAARGRAQDRSVTQGKPAQAPSQSTAEAEPIDIFHGQGMVVAGWPGNIFQHTEIEIYI
ncbi:hypothetical protein BDV09DRAFT_180817 [Aspergillus tetrazonus]